MLDIREIIVHMQKEMEDIMDKVAHNNEQNRRLIDDWESQHNTMTNFIVSNEEDILSKLDFSAVLRIIKEYKPTIIPPPPLELISKSKEVSHG